MESFTLSNAARVIQCPGSTQLTPRVDLVREDNETRLEGKTADDIILKLLDGVRVAPCDDGGHGVPITEDMIEHCQGYIDHIRETLLSYGVSESKICSTFAEWEVRLDWLTKDRKDVPAPTGRSDFRFPVDNDRVLLVWDFKYGHRPVEAVGNYQLSGAALSDDAWRHKIEEVRGFIYQPRDFTSDGPVKEWRFDRDEIKMQTQKFRTAACKRIEPDAPLNTGPECRNCAAQGICPALWEDIMSGKTVLDAPVSATPEEIGERLTLVRQLHEQSGNLKENLASQGLHFATKSGKHVPGFKVVRGITQRRVKDKDTIIAVAPLYGVDVDTVTKRTTRSLKELEKALGPELLGEFTEKPPGRLELAPEDDKRPVAVQTNAAEVFSTPATGE